MTYAVLVGNTPNILFNVNKAGGRQSISETLQGPEVGLSKRYDDMHILLYCSTRNVKLP